jgi:hypothetical protein
MAIVRDLNCCSAGRFWSNLHSDRFHEGDWEMSAMERERREADQVIGETLSRYRVIARLGSGSMGDVYRAEDLRLRRPVALKVVSMTGEAPDASQRLLAEARAASALTHPNVAVVYEVTKSTAMVRRWASSRWSISLTHAGQLAQKDRYRSGDSPRRQTGGGALADARAQTSAGHRSLEFHALRYGLVVLHFMLRWAAR